MLKSVSELGASSFRRCPDWVLSGGLGLSVAKPRRGTLVFFCGVSERYETRDTHESPEEECVLKRELPEGERSRLTDDEPLANQNVIAGKLIPQFQLTNGHPVFTRNAV